MDYERKYKEALEIARKINSGEGVEAPSDWTICEVIFPELKENKDDRIVRCLLNYFNHVRYNGLDLKGTDVDEVIAWLEKQKDNIKLPNSAYTSNKDVIEFADKYSHDVWKKLMDNFKKIENYHIGCNDVSDIVLNAIVNTYNWLEKQDEKKRMKKHIFNADDWYVSKVDGKIHNMTYNPTDKVKPEFKVGDFIANDYCSGKVIEITNDAYLLDTGQGIPFSCEHNAHLWSINDAKDGDVLIKEETEEPFIYNGNRGSYLPEFVGGYCGICDGKFKPNGSTCYWGRPACPSTKEQCDTLFAKMKEAGYEWDSEKKELKKIEPKKLNADEVIAWLVGNICDYEFYVKLFKIDFGL